MITNSIFILGAGSSAEYGMPLWKDLAKEMRLQFEAIEATSWERDLDRCVQGVIVTEEDTKYAVSFLKRTSVSFNGQS